MEIQLFDRHFQIYDDKFEYSAVSRIRWVPQERIRFFLFLPAGMIRVFQLTIEFNEGPPVELGSGGVPGGWNRWLGLGKEDFRALRQSMDGLLSATRDGRLARYRAQLERNGAFEYDDKMFGADGTVDINGRRKTLDLKTPAKAIDSHTEIKCLPRGSIAIRTDWDRDCFHILLNELYRQRATR